MFWFIRRAGLRAVLSEIQSSIVQLTVEIRKMSATLDSLRAQVERNSTVTGSAVALLNGLKQQLDDAIASGDPAAVQQLSDQLGVQTDALAEAITTNTSSA